MQTTKILLSCAFTFALVFFWCIQPARAQQTQVGDLQPLLANLDEVTTATRVSLAKLRIEKWKVQSEVKRRLQADAQAIDRNLTDAVPNLAGKLRAEPQSLAANFAMYRNLDAVHDVLNLLTQSAGAVAPDDEYSALANNASRLDEVRKAFADRMESLASSKDAEIARLQSAPVEAKGQPAPAPKKIVIDDTAPTKKPS